jgi:hypothetical protein
MLASLVAHVVVNPETTPPFESSAVAVACVTSPILIVGAASVTSSDATTDVGSTVTDEEPVVPLIVAVIAAFPGLTPVTTPLVETPATFASLELHVMVAFVIVSPLSFVATAVACVVCPTFTEPVANETPTERTKFAPPRVTTRRPPAFLPRELAEIVVSPADTAVTTPVVFSMVATVVSELDQSTTLPDTVIEFPFASRSVA